MHNIHPDFVGMKAAVRQFSARLELEEKAALQWAALAKNRGAPDVAGLLEAAARAIKEAEENASGAARLLSRDQ